MPNDMPDFGLAADRLKRQREETDKLKDAVPDFGAAADRLVGSKADVTLKAVEGRNPDQDARAQDLAGKAGLPAQAVEGNEDIVDRKLQGAAARKALRDARTTARWLTDPNNAKVAHDDVPALAELEASAGALGQSGRRGGGKSWGREAPAPTRTLRDVANVGRAFAAEAGPGTPGRALRGLGDANAAAARLLNRGVEQVSPEFAEFLRAPVLPWWLNPTEILRRPGETLVGVAEEIGPEAEERNIATEIAGGLGQLASQIALAIISGGLSSGTSLAAMAGQGVDQQTEMAEQAGEAGTPGADAAALLGGGITVVTERFGLDALLNKIPAAVKTRLGRALSGLSTEAIQELTEGVWQRLTAATLVDPDIEIFNVDEMTHEGTVGGAVGFIASAIIPGRQAVAMRNAMDEVDKAARATRLNDRLPVKAAEHRAALLREQGVDEIAISADAMREYFQANEDVDPDAWLRNLGVTPEQYQEALDRNGDVELAPDAWATILGGDAYVSFKDHMRYGAESMTAAEAEEWLTTGLKEEMDRAAEDLAALGKGAQAEAAAIEAEVSQMLEAIGEPTDAAALIAARYATRAARSGGQVTATELWQRDRLRIVGPDAAPRTPLDDLQLRLNKAREGGPKMAKSPVLDMLRADGVQPGSPLAGELNAMGVTTRTHPGLFKEGGRTAADNFVQSESDLFRDDQATPDGYVPEASILAAISEELAGNPRRTLDEAAQLEAFDTDTANLEAELDELGLSLANTDEEIRAAITTAAGREYSQTDEFKAWFGDSKVVDANGEPLVVYHGTTADFEAFDNERANIESDLGGGFYFTNNQAEVAVNYAGFGPDLTQKIDLTAERIAAETDREYDDPDVMAEARARFVNHEGATVPVYLSMQNPVEIGGENETRLDYEQEYDEDTDEYGDETGTLVDFVMALRNELESSEVFDGDADTVVGEILEAADYDSITASKLIDVAKASEGLAYSTVETSYGSGDLVGNEILRRAFEAAGFDGFIDRTVNKKFGSERDAGKVMEGMDENTVHFIAFHPTQIKSIFNRGTFNPNDARILEQSAAPLQTDALDVTGTGPGGRVTNWDLGEALTARHMEVYGRALDPSDPADYKIIVDEMFDEYTNQLLEHDTGHGWYVEDIAKAIDITTAIIPELSVPVNRDLFLTIAALTSPQQKPRDNWQNAIYAMQGYLRDGKIALRKPNGKQFGVLSHTTGLQLMQHLIDTYGVAGAVAWVREPHTGREIAEVRKASGIFAPKDKLQGYLANETNLTETYPGIAMMGPKVGEFMQNATGFDQNAVTVDLWMARTYNRMVGRLLEVPAKDRADRKIAGQLRGKGEREHIKRIVRDLAERAKIDPSAMQAALWYFEQRLYRNHGIRSDSQNFSGAAQTAAEKAGVDTGGSAGAQSSGGIAAQGMGGIARGFSGHEGVAYEQPARGSIRLSPDEIVIQLGANADRSTFLHESGHLFLEQLAADAREFGEAQTVDDWNAVKDWWAGNAASLKAEAIDYAKKAKDDDAVLALAKMTDAQVAAVARRGRLGVKQLDRAAALDMVDGWREIKPGDTVSGLTVREGVDNYGSIAASLNEYDVIGLREVPMDLFTVKAGEPELAAAITESGELSPLIVVVDGLQDGAAYILEGSHRIDAAKAMGLKSIPALVVVDVEAFPNYYEQDGPPRRDTSPIAYLQRAMHEQWARGTEDYFRTGQAPSVALQEAFNKFRAWLVSIYRALRGRGLDVKFSPEVKAVMDRMLATDEEIALVEEQYNLKALFTSAEEIGMTPAQFEAYQRNVARAREDAKTRHLKRHLNQIEREKKQWWEDEARKVRAVVEAEFAERKVYRALYALTRSETPLGEAAILDHGRLDRKATLAVLESKAALGRLPKVRGKAVYTTAKGESGSHPDVIAQLYGYQDGRTMLMDLANVEPFNAAVTAETDRRMKAKHGDMLNDGTAEAEALKATHTDRRGDVLMQELNALREGADKLKPGFVRQWARERIAARKIDDIKPQSFLFAERRAAREAGRLLRKGDRLGAQRAKFQQLLNFYMAREAYKVRDEVSRGRTFFRKYTNPATKHPTIDADYVDRIHQILENYNFMPRLSDAKRDSLMAWAAIEAENNGAILAIPAEIAAADGKTHFRDLTLDEWRTLYDTVKNIEAQGRLVKEAEIDGERILVDDIAEKVVEINEDRRPQVGRVRRQVTKSQIWVYDPVLEFLHTADAAMLKIEFMLNEIDGEEMGVLHHAIFQQVANAEHAQNDLTIQVTKPIIDALNKLTPKRMNEKIPVGQAGVSYRVSELLMMALNVGNESNYDKMIRGSARDAREGTVPLTEEIVDEAMSHLTADEWVFVQTVWDAIESMYPQVEAVFRKENGVSPVKIEPRPFVTKYGQEMRGGYFPMMYDPEAGRIGKAIEDMNALRAMQAGPIKASVYSGMTNERTGAAYPVLFDLNALPGHIEKTAHYITHYDVVRSSDKIISHPEVDRIIRNRFGPEYLDALRNWMRDVAVGKEAVAGSDIIGRTVEWARGNTTIAIMGASATTILTQPLGVFTSIDALAKGADPAGKKYKLGHGAAELLRAYMQYLPRFVRAANQVREASGEMRHRIQNTERDLRRQFRKLEKKNTRWPAFQRATLMGIAGAQFYTVDVPTWLAAYNQALKQGRAQPDAVQYADSILRKSQGGGAVKDLAGVQRKSGAAVAWTMFYSFQNLMYAIQRGIIGDVKGARDVPQAAARFFVVLMLPSMIEAVMRQEWPDDDENYAEFISIKALANSLGSIVGIRDLAGGLTGYDYQMSPIANVGKNLTTSIPKLAEAIDEGEIDKATQKAASSLFGYLAGAPASQVNRVLDAAYSDDPTFWDFVVGPKRD